MDRVKLQCAVLQMEFGQTVYYNQPNPAGNKHAVHFSARTVLGRCWPGLVAMKNIYEVLRNKEMDLVRLRTEVDALRLVAPLLADQLAESSDVDSVPRLDAAWSPALQKNKWPLKVGHPAPSYSDS
jgi:hypothetical protein